MILRIYRGLMPRAVDGQATTHELGLRIPSYVVAWPTMDPGAKL